MQVGSRRITPSANPPYVSDQFVVGEQQLLHPPVGAFGDVDLIRGQASWWPPENSLRLRPDFPITPSTLPSSVI
jgi:hypothetical protein